MDALKGIWSVKAGVLSGEADPRLCRQWSITSGELDGLSPEAATELFVKRRTAAHEYAAALTDPSRLNWVTVEFLWF
jgi:hypothetical protein